MKYLLFSLIFSLQLFANECDQLEKVRALFKKGVNEVELGEMIQLCESNATCNLIIPYWAAATMKKAEFAWSPLNKLKYFNKGKKMLEDFIKKNPTNIEAKYIRWLTQKMAPAFLSYNKNLADDYQYIQKNIAKSAVDKEYQTFILKHIQELQNE